LQQLGSTLSGSKEARNWMNDFGEGIVKLSGVLFVLCSLLLSTIKNGGNHRFLFLIGYLLFRQGGRLRRPLHP